MWQSIWNVLYVLVLASFVWTSIRDYRTINDLRAELAEVRIERDEAMAGQAALMLAEVEEVEHHEKNWGDI